MLKHKRLNPLVRNALHWSKQSNDRWLATDRATPFGGLPVASVHAGSTGFWWLLLVSPEGTSGGPCPDLKTAFKAAEAAYGQ